MNYFIIVFKNTHDAMSAEGKLKELDYSFRIMPTPTLVTQSCGICIRIDNKKSLDEILSKEIIKFKNVYKREDFQYVQIR